MKPNRIILQLITVALILCYIFICACTGTENGGEDFAVSTSGETASAAVTDGDTSGEGNPDGKQAPRHRPQGVHPLLLLSGVLPEGCNGRLSPRHRPAAQQITPLQQSPRELSQSSCVFPAIPV